MWNRVALVTLLAVTGCQTTKGAWQGIGIGGGAFIGGALLTGATDRNNVSGEATDAEELGTLIGVSGLIVLVVSTIALLPLEVRKDDTIIGAQPLSAPPVVVPERAPPQGPPGTVPPIRRAPVRVPEGAIIRAEGSACTGKRDVCAVGLACVDGLCRAPSP